MIPNDFGLIRQKDRNLLALPFTDILNNLSEYHIELIPAVWTNGFWNSSGSPTSSSLQVRCTVNVSKYDFVIAPCESNRDDGVATGLGQTQSAETFISHVEITNKNTRCFSLFPVKSPFSTVDAEYLKCSIRARTENLPIIGIYKHRADNVNPKGIIKDVNSDLLQPVKKDELNGEADRIREDLPGNTESSDLDIKSGAGACERADG